MKCHLKLHIDITLHYITSSSPVRDCRLTRWSPVRHDQPSGGQERWTQLSSVHSREEAFAVGRPKPNFFTCAWLAFKHLRLLFGLAEKNTGNVLFRPDNSHLTKYRAKCMAKSANHFSRWKKVENAVHKNTVG